MKELITSVFLAIAVTGFSATANAVTWSPTGPGAVMSIGEVLVAQGLQLNCGLSASTLVTENGDAAFITSLQLSGFLCSAIGFDGLPYELKATSATSIMLLNVSVAGLTGDCFGDLAGEFDQATGTISFIDATLPSMPPGDAPCRIVGTLSTTPQGSYTFP